MIGQSSALDRAQALAEQVDQLVRAWARACQDVGLPIRVESLAFLAALGHEPRLYLSLEAYCSVEGCESSGHPVAASSVQVEDLGAVRDLLARVWVLVADGCQHLRQVRLMDSDILQCALGLALVEGA